MTEPWTRIRLLFAAFMLSVSAPVSAPVMAASVANESLDESLTRARDRVEAFHGVLLASMRSGEPFPLRLARVQPAVLNFLDVPGIARICLGRTWRDLDTTARDEFTRMLGELISATYADRFDGDKGQTFVTRSVDTARGGIVVKTVLQRPNAIPVQLDYYFRRGKAFNVVADGVSDLSLRRADYNAIVKDQGYDALLAHIREQLTDLGVGHATEANQATVK